MSMPMRFVRHEPLPVAPGRALLRLVVLVALVVATTTVWSQEPIEHDPARLERERQIEAKAAMLRTLHSQGRFEEVIVNARELLALDPNNVSATLWMDRAQARLAREGSSVPGFGDRRRTPPPSPFDEGPGVGTVVPTPARVDTPQTDPVPLPYVPTPITPASSGGLLDTLLSPLVLILLGVGAVIFIGVAIFAVVRMRRSQAQLQAAIQDAERRRQASAVNDVHDAITQVGGAGMMTAGPNADEDSVMQFGEVGTSRDNESDVPPVYAPDPVTSPPEQDDPDTMHLTPSAPGNAPVIEEQRDRSYVAIPMVMMEEPVPGDKESEPLALGAYQEPAESPSPDSDMTFGSLMFGGSDETAMPQAAPKSPAQPEQSYASLMFSGEGETVAPSGKPAPAAPADPEMSYNSLMFSAADETRMPAPSVPSSPPPDDAEISYASLMFSDADETQMSGAQTVLDMSGERTVLDTSGAGQPPAGLDETIRLDVGLEPGLADDPLADEKTLPLLDPDKHK